VGALGRLDGLDATVYVREPDASYLTGSARPPWDNGKGALQRALDIFGSTPSLPVETVEDGDTVGPFTAYATPGHSPGRTAFVSEAHDVGFLCDILSKLDPVTGRKDSCGVNTYPGYETTNGSEKWHENGDGTSANREVR
jgi:glyoxylase-like metal-dependent hydrolase (beta-lactamase superfamily II)